MLRKSTVLLALVFGGCAGRGEVPPPPLGAPDDVSVYENAAHRSIDYNYYCLNGQFVSIRYVSGNASDRWHEESRFVDSGICGTKTLDVARRMARQRFGTVWPASPGVDDAGRRFVPAGQVAFGAVDAR